MAVNHDGRGGTAPDPLVWDQGGRKKTRRTDIRVTVDLASLPGSIGFLNGPWLQVHGGRVADAGIAASPCSVGILCKFTAFLGTLHWPVGPEDMGHFGISYLELPILLEQWAGHRLLNEKVIRPHLSAHRPISFSSVPVSEGIEIRHGCQYISSLVRALVKLPGGLGRFLPSRVWITPVQVKASWVEPVFSWTYFQALGILPSPMPQGCMLGFGLSQGSSIGALWMVP